MIINNVFRKVKFHGFQSSLLGNKRNIQRQTYLAIPITFPGNQLGGAAQKNWPRAAIMVNPPVPSTHTCVSLKFFF
jgi:hypothetical protein